MPKFGTMLRRMEDIEKYYTEKNVDYDFSTENGLRKYISDMLN